jgi:hypothetical protein
MTKSYQLFETCQITPALVAEQEKMNSSPAHAKTPAEAGVPE